MTDTATTPEEVVAKLCGYCLRKVRKTLIEPPRKLLATTHPCEHCPAYYAKVTVRYTR